MKRSALYSLHLRAGATFAEYSGWELPAFFASREQEAARIRKTVGLTDVSHSLKIDSRSKPEQPSWRLGANHYLAVGESTGTPPAEGIDVRTGDVLNKLTSLNLADASLPNLSCAQASLAHVPGIFLREDIGPIPGFHLLVTRDCAESVWEAILHAGHEFHICPSGLDALRLLPS
jgi:glycine cleavage system aminomethyltransferase T